MRGVELGKFDVIVIIIALLSISVSQIWTIIFLIRKIKLKYIIKLFYMNVYYSTKIYYFTRFKVAQSFEI